MSNSEAIPEEHKEWEPLLTGAIGDKDSYSKAEVLWAMYLAVSDAEWENHPENPMNQNTDTNG